MKIKALNHVQSVVERRNTIPILSNVLIEREGRQLRSPRPISTSRSSRRVRGRGLATGLDHRAGPHALRHRAQAARRRAGAARTGRRRRPPGQPVGRPLALFDCSRPAAKAISPISAPARCPTASSAPAGDLKPLIEKTRFAISTEETRYYLNGIYLHATKAAPAAGAARRGDRWPSPGALRDAAARGCRRHAGRHRAAQDGGGGGQAAGRDETARCRGRAVRHQDPLRRLGRGADLEADRRHLPRLRARHPARQRQDPGADAKNSPSRSTAFPPSRRQDARGEAERSAKGKLTLSVVNPESGRPPRMSGRLRAGPLEVGFNARYLLDITARSKARKCASCCRMRVRPPSSKMRRTRARSTSSCLSGFDLTLAANMRVEPRRRFPAWR
jgi:DNA polymerase-3 subunit beta